MPPGVACRGNEPATGLATLRTILSPVPSPLGRLHQFTQNVVAGQPVRAYVPERQVVAASINGGLVPPDEYDTRILQPGEELLLKPTIQGGVVEGALIAIAVGIIVSIGTHFLMKALFPPQRPKMQEQDDPIYGFEGIRSTVGPGAKVPVVYGRHRIGGQYLRASVESGAIITTGDGTSFRFPEQDAVSFLNVLLALGEGEIEGIETLAEPILLNGQPVANFPTVTLTERTGTSTQTAIPKFSEARNSFADGREITAGGIVYTTTQDVTGYQVTISFDEGLAWFDDKGQKLRNQVHISVRHRVSPAGAWSATNQVIFIHETTAVVRGGLRRNALALETYDIEVALVHAQHTEGAARFRPFLESVMELQAGVEAFPDTALMGLEAMATENLNGAIPNVTCVVKGLKVRVGSFAVAPTWSQNPAWCLMDYLTNTRYGLGIPDADINLTAFHTFAAYCDETIDGEARHLLDIVIVEDAEEVIQQILSSCRAVMYKIQGQWAPLPLRADPPVQLLSWTNCTNVKLTYSRDPDQINVMEGRFADEAADWEASVLTWPEVDNWPLAMQKSTIDLRGVTRRSAVMRHLQYELNRRRLPKLTLRMDCAMDALALAVNDIFRFSHPLPGWGTSGRIQPGSTTTTIFLDEEVSFLTGRDYHLYVRHEDDTIETKAVVNPGTSAVKTLTLSSALSQTPVAINSTYAFGQSSPVDTAVREFRVVRMERLTDQTIRLEAVQHNPAIYDDAVASPLPVISDLFNPLGPPPALTSLVLLELPRVGPDGRSRVVANLAWDTAPLSAGFAPYGGAIIYRRDVVLNATAGLGTMGGVGFAELQSAGDETTDYIRLATVRGAVLEYDDSLVITDTTYQYKVVPISGRGVPNNLGALTGVIHIGGATTPGFFPGTVTGLRLAGQAEGETTFEGPDVHLVWDRLVSVLFTTTFFLKEYVVEVWAPGQAFLLRHTTVSTEAFTYTLDMNAEDHGSAGFAAPSRDLLFLVRARTNTNRESLVSASLLVHNPPPDMSALRPAVVPLVKAGMVDWTQFVEPRDFDHYVVKFDVETPPNTTFSSVSLALKKVFPQGLEAGTVYYAQIVPYDTFGVGVPSQIAELVPLSISIDDLDMVPPATPTNLQLTTGTTISDDGTVVPWIAATWDSNTEADLKGYQVNFRMGGTNNSPTVVVSDQFSPTVRIDAVAGGVTFFVKVAAFDIFRNFSDFTDEESIVSGTDTQPPAAPSNLSVRGFFQAHVLSWSPPADADLSTIEIWANLLNDRDDAGTFLVAEVPGTDAFFQHGPLDSSNTSPMLGTAQFGGVTAGSNQTYTLYYWLRSKDRSGNVSPWHPGGADEGVVATAALLTGGALIQSDALITNVAQIGNAIIQDAHIQSLSASKLLAGTIEVLIRLGVGNIEIDAPHDVLRVKTPQGVVTVELGLLDPGQTQSRNYGLRVYDPNGVVLFDASQLGLTGAAIRPGLINAHHLRAAIIEATHIRTDVAIITVAAQIANALIGTAHIEQAAITSALIGTAQIQSAHIGAAQIQSAHIGTAQIQSAHIEDLSVNNAKIQNLTVGTEKIQNNAVSSIARSFSQSATILDTDSSEQLINDGVITDVTAGSVAVLTYTGTITAGPPSNFTNHYEFRVREDSVVGTQLASILNLEQNGQEVMFFAIQAVWQAPPAPAPTKSFAITAKRVQVFGDEYTALGHLVIQHHKK